MTDQRVSILAKNLVNYSCRVQKGEKVMIRCIGEPHPVVPELIKQIYAAGGHPFVDIREARSDREILKGVTKEYAEMKVKYDLFRYSDMNAVIAVHAPENIYENSDVPSDNLMTYQKICGHPISNHITKHTKWVVLNFPNAPMAQMANMSTEQFEDFYFKVCCLDYAKMDKAMDSLAALIAITDKVKIKGPGTDLEFSIKGIGSEKCAGKMNIPDGEIFTAPVKTSVNGTITYNAPTIERGTRYENISLTFKDGKIVKATAGENTEKLNKVLDTDEGARYVGEFAFGVNPHIKKPMCDILFDEKISGSIHFTPGRCYDDVPNGNESAVHWDMVLIQTPEYGGGEIWFDGKLIRKDGRFVTKELECLNPENLI